MKRETPFEAVVLDMDGVLTRTADLHMEVWKRMFDDFLEQRDGQTPFSEADYRAHVDGKPRYQGVEDFLRSRGLELPRGEPSDDAGVDTVCGLGNRKNALFLRLLEERGVKVFDDTVMALKRWRRGGMKLGLFSASRNCRRMVEAAGLEQAVDVIVDGETAAQLNLEGKPEIMKEAARRLETEPANAVVLEDAVSGVRAGRESGFGLVVGVSRNGGGDDLKEAGSHRVTDDVYAISFLRQIPHALECMADLSAWRKNRPLALFLDFDGTLADIVDEPDKAEIFPGGRSVLESLTCPVAVISGRNLKDLQSRVDVEGIYYAGNHGFDIAGGNRRRTLPEAEAVLDDVDRAEQTLREQVAQLAGVILERKRYSLAVHYRKVKSESVLEKVKKAVGDVERETGLRKRSGKKVLELEPDVDWNKGRALRWLMDILPPGGEGQYFVVYAGDDTTDEDAFAALRDDGPGIYVGESPARSLADYHLRNPEEVLRFLQALADVESGDRGRASE